MPCRKTLSLSGACELETCTTDDKVSISPEIISSDSFGYASDLCYAMFMARNAANTETYIYRYIPETNTVSKKATIPGNVLPPARLAYDVAHQKFVWPTGFGGPNTIWVFDPLTDLVTSFSAGGLGPSIGFFYIPQKGRIYGEMGPDGTGLTYIGYIDLDLQLVIRLGTIPAVGPSKPRPYNLVYVPSTDTVYGCWATGLGASMAKFDLTTNTGNGNIIPAGIEGSEICLDTDRNLLIVHYGTVKEVNPTTELVVGTYLIPADRESIVSQPYYSSTLKKVFGLAGDQVTGESCIESWDTTTQVTGIVFGGDAAHSYDALLNFKDGSCLTEDWHDPTNNDGVRRLCLT